MDYNNLDENKTKSKTYTENEWENEMQEGLTEERKKQIQKDLEEMTIEEIENEIEAMSTHLKKMLLDGINRYWDIDILKILLYTTGEGKYVVERTNEIKEDIRTEYNNIVRKIELAVDFCEKYYIYGTLSWEMGQSSLFLDTMINNNEYNDKKLEIANKICEENNALYKGYEDLYKECIRLYIENEIDEEKFIKLQEINRKIKENMERIPKKENNEF